MSLSNSSDAIYLHQQLVGLQSRATLLINKGTSDLPGSACPAVPTSVQGP
jgi:hypothetical protein